MVLSLFSFHADYLDCSECSSGSCWCNDTNNITCCQSCKYIMHCMYGGYYIIVTLNCDCNGERCFRNNDNQTYQCCHQQCAAGCFGRGNSNQCQVNCTV